jgi:3-dehydroquinate synthase
MHIIPVRLTKGRGHAYDVVVGPGLLEELPARLAGLGGGGDLFLITDATVNRLYGRALAAACERTGVRTLLLEVPAGEGSKNADLVFRLQTELLTHGVHRGSLVVALGGGVVGDLAGFTAATVLRGVPFVQVPTTLLAQVDSSVGGKVGIDHPSGKNLIGAFCQPRAVFIDPRFLASLSERQFRNGLAEVVKIASALDASFFAFLRSRAHRLVRTNVRLLEHIIARSVALKGAVVERDEFERDLRRSLNLGHTIGHALEAASGYRLQHGEAVSVGMAAEAGFAVRLGLMTRGEQRRLCALLVALGLPVRFPGVRDRARFLAALALDKKGVAGKARFVLPAGIGVCALGVEVPREMIEQLLDGA